MAHLTLLQLVLVFCKLLISNLDPDQAGHFVRPGVDPNCFVTLLAFLQSFFFLKSLKNLKETGSNCRQLQKRQSY